MRVQDIEARRAYHKQWRDKNRERMKATRVAWAAANHEKIRKSRLASAAKHRDKIRRRSFKRRYGVDLADMEALLARQGGMCALCSRSISYALGKRTGGACTDHCHSTGRIRGVLCVGCNTAIGRFGDTLGGTLRAVAYLQADVLL